jgi:hypothetical protein
MDYNENVDSPKKQSKEFFIGAVPKGAVCQHHYSLEQAG